MKLEFMEFNEALEKMMNGHKIWRKSIDWGGSHYFCFYDKPTRRILTSVLTPAGEHTELWLNQDSILADDWLSTMMTTELWQKEWERVEKFKKIHNKS